MRRAGSLVIFGLAAAAAYGAVTVLRDRSSDQPETAPAPATAGQTEAGLRAELDAMDNSSRTLSSVLEKLEARHGVVGTSSEPTPRPENAHVPMEDLLGRYRAMNPGPEREALLRDLTSRHHRYFWLEKRGDASFAPAFMQIAETASTSVERREAIIALHGLSAESVVDWYIRSANHPDPQVRFYAVEGLAWVREGPAVPRARSALRDALSHEDSRVRGIAVACMAAVTKDPAEIPALEAAQRAETDPDVRRGIETALRRLRQKRDKAGG